MTGDLLDVLIRVNLAGSAAIVAVIAGRKLLRRLAGARVASAFWWLVPLACVAVLLPPRVVTLRLAPVPVVETAVVSAPALMVSPGADTATPSTDQPSSLAPAPPPIRIDMKDALLALWLLGALASLGWVCWRHAQFLRELGPLRRRGDGLWQAERSRIGPAVIGVLRPRIMLPADFEARFSPSEQAAIIAHETRHLTAGHAQTNAVAVLAQSLCWFNPLAYVAVHLFRIDQELACDEAVIAAAPDVLRTYAEAMIRAQLAEAALPLGCYWPSRSPHPLRERIAMLSRPDVGRARRRAGGAGLVLIALAGTCAAWAAQPAVMKVETAAASSGVTDEPTPPVAIFAANLAPSGHDLGQPLPKPDEVPPNPLGNAATQAAARQAFAQGASAREVVEVFQAAHPERPYDLGSAHFAKTPDGKIVVMFDCLPPANCQAEWSMGAPPPGFTTDVEAPVVGSLRRGASIDGPAPTETGGASAPPAEATVAQSSAFMARATVLGAVTAPGDYRSAAASGASAAQVVRMAQARGALIGVNPDTAVVVIGPDGSVLNTYPVRPLPPLPAGVAVADTHEIGGDSPLPLVANPSGFSTGFGIPYPAGSIVLLPPGVKQPETCYPNCLLPSLPASPAPTSSAVVPAAYKPASGHLDAGILFDAVHHVDTYEGYPVTAYLGAIPDAGGPAVILNAAWEYTLTQADGTQFIGKTPNMRSHTLYLCQGQAYALSLEGDKIRIQSAYYLANGQIAAGDVPLVKGPDILLPLHGGTRSVRLPGGAKLSVTIHANSLAVPSATAQAASLPAREGKS